MNNKRLGVKLFIGAVAIATLSNTLTLAVPTGNSKHNMLEHNGLKESRANFFKERLNATLDSMVKEGTINKAQKDLITSKLVEKVFIGPMQALVVDGVITQEEFEIICKAMIEGRKAGKTRNAVLQKLVEDGKITIKQKEEIINKTPIIPTTRKGFKGFKINN